MNENLDQQTSFEIVDVPQNEPVNENDPTVNETPISITENQHNDEPLLIESAEPENQDQPLPETIDANMVIDMFSTLNQKFDSKITNDTHKNQLFDKMYSELQSLKDDPFKKAIKPIFMDLIVFIDFIRTMSSKYVEQPAEEDLLATYQKLRGEFAKVGGHIEDLLYNHGVESFSANQGDVFDPKNQQAKKTTTAENEDENKLVVESIAPGYNWNDSLLRKESVHISISDNTNK